MMIGATSLCEGRWKALGFQVERAPISAGWLQPAEHGVMASGSAVNPSFCGVLSVRASVVLKTAPLHHIAPATLNLHVPRNRRRGDPLSVTWIESRYSPSGNRREGDLLAGDDEISGARD